MDTKLSGYTRSDCIYGEDKGLAVEVRLSSWDAAFRDVSREAWDAAAPKVPPHLIHSTSF